MNFLPEKKYGVPSHNFVKKNVLCKKGDEITRCDGIHSKNDQAAPPSAPRKNFWGIKVKNFK